MMHRNTLLNEMTIRILTVIIMTLSIITVFISILGLLMLSIMTLRNTVSSILHSAQ